MAEEHKTFEFEALAAANRYRRAIVSELAPYLGKKVVEIGAGVGQITASLQEVPSVETILAVEPERDFHDAHRGRPWTLLRGTSRDVDARGDWDSAVLVNVLEHIESDVEELAWLRQLVRPATGHVCVLVPARPELYAEIDRDFGHFRRYTQPELQSKFTEAGLEMKACHYFNWAGYFAWGLSMKLLRQRRFSKGSVRFYDQYIFPWVHWMERRVARPPFGQSLIAIGTAP